MSTRIPVTILSGYLGSGKTTLLQRLLAHTSGRRAAVLINEFGEISLDHLLARPINGSTVVLQNGCLCCSVRSELQAGLRELLTARAKSEVPEFDRVLIETTGLADPVPIVQSLVADPMLRNQVFLAGLVVTVDALNGLDQLATQPEAARQAATADRLVVTKTDLSRQEDLDRLLAELAHINPAAPVLQVPSEGDIWSWVVEPETLGRGGQTQNRPSLFGRAERLAPGQVRLAQPTGPAQHGAGIRSFIFRTERPVDWTAFAVWLSLLVHRHGRRVLRVKGLLNVPGAEGPLCLNAVQHFIHPPEHLDAWPDADRSSRLVFIVQDLEEADVVSSLEHFLAATEVPTNSLRNAI